MQLLLALSMPMSGAAAKSSVPRSMVPKHGFFSSVAASRWSDALLTGNGVSGAMVFGQPLDETIILNHSGLFMPMHEPVRAPAMADRLGDIRALLNENKTDPATKIAMDAAAASGIKPVVWVDPLVPAFDLLVKAPKRGETYDYARMVDFATGEAGVVWSDEGGLWSRRVFVSRADNVVIVSIRNKTHRGVDADLRLRTRLAEDAQSQSSFADGVARAEAFAELGWLTYQAAFKKRWPGSLQGYEGATRVVNVGGTSRVEGDRILVRGAQEILILARVVLSNDMATSQTGALKTELESLPANYDLLLDRHVRLHGALFDRVSLDLDGSSERNLRSEELIAKSSVGNTSRALIEKQFDAARYIMISCAGDFPPTLQGIWGGSWAPAWSSSYTHDGNVPAAMEGNLSLNMAELMLPYFSYLERQLPQYRDNARLLYGARGILLPSATTSHGNLVHFTPKWCMMFWTAGAAWASHFFYDYYLYTGDVGFLRDRAVPFMKEAALFYEDFLTVDASGRYAFNPSYSPENVPANLGNNESQASRNAAMDIAAASELLRNLISACEILHIEREGVERWRSMLGRMPSYTINSDGAVKEWISSDLEDNYRHRHASHLYALYYGMPPDIAAKPSLVEAFRKALELRMDYRRADDAGEMAFGLLQLGGAAASLRDRRSAALIIEWLSNWYWGPALTSTHNKHALFNVDICGGMPALVARMLIDTQPGFVDFLPLLPSAWPNGSIRGIRGRGGLMIDVQWRNATLKTARILSVFGGPLRIRANGREIVRQPKAGERIALTSDSFA
jgi:hypothetical protein